MFRVVALPAPTEREQSQVYMQRYIQHSPAAGEVVIFDRSWCKPGAASFEARRVSRLRRALWTLWRHWAWCARADP